MDARVLNCDDQMLHRLKEYFGQITKEEKETNAMDEEGGGVD